MPILLLTIMLSGMGFGLVLPAFLFYAQNVGGSVIIATTIVGCYSLGQFIANPIWGRMSDRHGRKPMLLLSMGGMVVAYLVMAFAENLWVLGIARLMTGLMGGNIPVAMAYITDITPVEKRAQGMGLVGGAISIGFIVGPALGGLLGGADADTATLLWPSLAAAGLSAVTLIATCFLKESLPAEKRAALYDADRPTGWAATKTVLQRSILARLIVIGFLAYFAMGFFETIMPLWTQALFDWGPVDLGFCFMYLGLIVGFTQAYLVGKLAPLYGEAKLVLFGVGAYVFGLLWMTQVPNWQLMLVGITFTAGGGALATTSMTSLVSRQASEHERGLVLGVYNSGAWMGRFLGPPMSGLLFQTIAVQAPLYGAAMIMAVCFIAVAALRKRMRREAATG